MKTNITYWKKLAEAHNRSIALIGIKLKTFKNVRPNNKQLFIPFLRALGTERLKCCLARAL